MLPISVTEMINQGSGFLSSVIFSQASLDFEDECLDPVPACKPFPWHQLPPEVQDIVLASATSDTIKMCMCVSKRVSERTQLLGRCLKPSNMPSNGLSSFPSVVELDLSRVPRIMDEELIAFLTDEHTSQPRGLEALTLKRAKALKGPAFRHIAQISSLTALNLALCYGLNDESLALLGHRLPHLTSLNIRRCHKVTDAGIEALAPTATNLTSLNVSCCSSRMGDASARAIAAHLKKLVCLKADAMAMLTDHGMEALAKGLSRLKHLSVDRLQRRFPHDTKLTSRSLSLIADGMPCLQLLRINLQNCRDDLEACEVNPGLRMVSNQLHCLQHLELYKAARLGDASIEAIAAIPRLQHLVLHEARKVTDAGFQRMVAGIAEQSDKGGSLRYLELNRCSLLSRNAIASLSQLRGLQMLRMVGLSPDTFRGITALAATAVPLRFLDIKGDVEIQDAVPCTVEPSLLTSVGKLRTLNGLGLRHLDLSAITNLEGLAPLTQLRVLSLSGCDKLHARSTSVISPNVLEGLDGAELTHLDLSLCTSLRNAGLAGAATCLGRLQSLHLGMCQSITRAGVMGLVPSLPELRYLNLSAVGGWKGINDTLVKDADCGGIAAGPDRSARLKIEYGAPLPWRAKVLSATSLEDNHSLARS